MSPRKKEAPLEPIEDIVVKLKPVLGISPRLYIPVIWLGFIAAVVFFLLILPGLRRNGTILYIESNPPGASILVDGVRIGRTGDEVFAPHGMRELVVRRTGFEDHVEERKIKGRVFASRLFPRRESFSIILHPQADFDFISMGLSNFQDWTATGPERDRYAIPPVLTAMARDAIAAGEKNTNSNTLATSALPASLDERHLADILRAETLLTTNGAPLGLSGMLETIDRASAILDSDIQTAGSIKHLIDEDRINSGEYSFPELTGPPKATKILEEYSEYYGSGATDNVRLDDRIAGLQFIKIPTRTVPVGDIEVVSGGYNPRYGAVPVIAHVDSYSISSREITKAEYKRFLDENKNWSVESRVSLVEENLVDEGYLSDWSVAGPPSGSGNEPVVRISWHAASAYTDWFSDKFLSGSLVARLPSEYEWEVAARLNGAPESSGEPEKSLVNADSAVEGLIGIRGLEGNAREWCLNPFYYNGYLFPITPEKDQANLNQASSAPRPVRGDCFIDDQLPFPAASRGSLPPSATSPVLGFRLVVSSN